MLNIRNFSIIAHIDHGKSTLADRILELTNSLPKSEITQQTLDVMELERERGITIKSKTFKIDYNFKNQPYILNLIDTPGHVDFTFEVSRSLNCVEGTILVVDATQGVEAQTLSNMNLAKELNLKIIPVINKIDLKNANVEQTENEVRELLNTEAEILKVSAKFGTAVERLIPKIIEEIPPPEIDLDSPAEAIIFDSFYDQFKGLIILLKIVKGKIKKNDRLKFLFTNIDFFVQEVGYVKIKLHPAPQLTSGEVGYIVTGLKVVPKDLYGDIVVDINYNQKLSCNIKQIKPFVFAGVYPINQAEFESLKDSIQKLHLTDSAFQFQNEYSPYTGPGFRCGFLGPLHLEIFKSRLEREFNQNIIVTVPNVVYQIIDSEKIIEIKNPAQLPDGVKQINEPIVKVTVVTPQEYIGAISELVERYRGKYLKMEYISPQRVILQFKMPLAEMIIDFYENLKSVSRGYASMDYEFIGFEDADLGKLEILIHGESIDSFVFIVHKENAYSFGKKIVARLKDLIPRHLFEIVLQAKFNNKIIVRENIPPLRKDVTAKCYGGDITRKRKLLEKQKEGKKRMKQFGKIEIPANAFYEILKK